MDHLPGVWKFRAYTSSPTLNLRSLPSCSSFVCPLCFSSHLGIRLSNIVLIFRPKRHSAGDFPSGVFGFGVLRYILRNGWIISRDTLDPSALRRARLNVSTNLSACPFDCGWYGGENLCRIPFCAQNS
ncbi:unnamed protein product [Dicrocoelium dendriticum]|nr:unnamed protein product [Dicrocoelium dendriticum]